MPDGGLLPAVGPVRGGCDFLAMFGSGRDIPWCRNNLRKPMPTTFRSMLPEQRQLPDFDASRLRADPGLILGRRVQFVRHGLQPAVLPELRPVNGQSGPHGERLPVFPQQFRGRPELRELRPIDDESPVDGQ
jgi:hypothetical protein